LISVKSDVLNYQPVQDIDSKELVSVIIPNWNNVERLKACLKAIQLQKSIDFSVEIIVVDNGSDDTSIEVAKRFYASVLQERSLNSPYPCRNKGIRKARGRYIALLDSNCIPDHNWMSAGIRAINSGKGDIVIGPVHFEFTAEGALFERFDFLYSVVREEDLPERRALPATHLFVKRSVFEKTGLFIPNIRSLGDIEWSNRAYRAGFRFGWAEEAVVSYPAKGFRAFVKKMLRLGRGKKEVWRYGGGSVWNPRWIWWTFKNFLPPNPKFVRRLDSLDRREKTEVGIFRLFWLAWLLKILRGWGMLFGQYRSDLYQPIPELTSSGNPEATENVASS